MTPVVATNRQAMPLARLTFAINNQLGGNTAGLPDVFSLSARMERAEKEQMGKEDAHPDNKPANSTASTGQEGAKKQ